MYFLQLSNKPHIIESASCVRWHMHAKRRRLSRQTSSLYYNPVQKNTHVRVD